MKIQLDHRSGTASKSPMTKSPSDKIPHDKIPQGKIILGQNPPRQNPLRQNPPNFMSLYHTVGVFTQYNLVSRVKSHVRLQLSEQLLCAAHKSSSNYSDGTCLAAFHGRLLISESSGSLVSFFGKLDIWFG